MCGNKVITVTELLNISSSLSSCFLVLCLSLHHTHKCFIVIITIIGLRVNTVQFTNTDNVFRLKTTNESLRSGKYSILITLSALLVQPRIVECMLDCLC